MYRKLGYTPIPIREGTKAPAIRWKDADKWDNKRYLELESNPHAERWGVGLATAGLVVLDVDSAEGHRKDADGVTAFQRLQHELGALPPTYTNTARGRDSASRHYLFRLPEAYKGKQLHAPAEGIDLRTDGGRYSYGRQSTPTRKRHTHGTTSKAMNLAHRCQANCPNCPKHGVNDSCKKRRAGRKRMREHSFQAFRD